MGELQLQAAALLENYKLSQVNGREEKNGGSNPFGFDESELICNESYEEFLSYIQVREFPYLLNDKPYEPSKKEVSCYADVVKNIINI